MTHDPPRDVEVGPSAPHISVAGWLILALIAAVCTLGFVAPAVQRNSTRGRLSACHANLVMMAKAVAMYETDYDEHLPPAASWADKISSYIQVSPAEAPWLCPADRRAQKQSFPPWYPDQKEPSQTSYTMSEACGGADEKVQPDGGVHRAMLFDGYSLAGGHSAAAFRHNGRLNVAYMDGHITYATQTEWPEIDLVPVWGRQPTGQPAPSPLTKDQY